MRAVSGSDEAVETEKDLEAAMEEFLRKQAEKESGKNCCLCVRLGGSFCVLQDWARCWL